MASTRAAVMVRKRYSPRPIKQADAPYYCVVTDRTRRVLSWKTLPVGTDLHQVIKDLFVAATEHHWTVENPAPLSSNFFCYRDKLRVLVHVRPTPPANPLSSWPLPEPVAELRDCLQI